MVQAMAEKELNYHHLKKTDYGRPPEKQNEVLQNIARPHVDSFNYMLGIGLHESIQRMLPAEFALPSGQRVSLMIVEAQIIPPRIQNNMFSNKLRMYPAESEACNLNGLSPSELIAHGEEAEEMGGYFIVNGNEKIIRMLIMQRRNYPMALTRPSWRTRGPAYTEFGVSMRCVAPDQTASTMVLHYLSNGSANLCFTYMKEQFFVPVVIVLKALLDVSDQYVFDHLTRGQEDSFYRGCITSMLRLARKEGLATQSAVLAYVGKRFRIKVSLAKWYTDEEVTKFLLRECICIHLGNNKDKFNAIVHMTKKLFAFAKGECAAESADNVVFQEALLGGHLYQIALKEKLQGWLQALQALIEKKAEDQGLNFQLDEKLVNNIWIHAPSISYAMNYLLATGNVMSKSGLGLMQATGMSVVADKLNFFRYLSHFRAIHRGAFFSEMRTTAVRKLLPEAWGFICPVHTPDGSPCGLLNHLSGMCQIVNKIFPSAHLIKILMKEGMYGYEVAPPYPYSECYPVMLDGRLVGWIPDADAKLTAENLRKKKVLHEDNVPNMIEICLVPKRRVASQYPGLYIFTTPTRMMRPVHNLVFDKLEMVGTFEQVHMEICVTEAEEIKGVTTHVELHQDVMLSVLASLTPFSDYNQSPRNIYQCQMGKQTMGTPLTAYQHRADNKLYRIQTPQAPMVRTEWYDNYCMDEYPLGTNAVVAVISYTGYDMEDAMILNKSSYERGFAHGSIYKSEFVDLVDLSKKYGRAPLIFGCDPASPKINHQLDVDGFPYIGKYLQFGDPYYCTTNTMTGEMKLTQYKSNEPAFVEQIKILGDDAGKETLRKVCIILRIVRNPLIGDKFASRHGQKGICSQKWPSVDMPFTESGMMPDIIFNPHGFPSRMTIGMMIESMAGKSAAMHGLCHDATPFKYSEEEPPIDYFGRMLEEAGYNYYGTERLYSGIDGRELEADIFMGIVYYQRLRHMVSDKFQVRTTGPVDIVTHQPVKGRKRAGGIRFGEMERDSLLSHGTSFLLEDRLLNCSDKDIGHVCVKCGSILSPVAMLSKTSDATISSERKQWVCGVCEQTDSVKTISIPYVFRYLTAELASMNIKMTLEIKGVMDHPAL